MCSLSSYDNSELFLSTMDNTLYSIKGNKVVSNIAFLGKQKFTIDNR